MEEYLTAAKASEQWLDLDGDGLPDRVAWPNWRRNTTSPGPSVPTFAPSAAIPGAPSPSPAPVFVGNPQGAAFMDIDGDGIMDLVTIGDDVATGPRCDYQAWLGRGTGSSYSLASARLCIDASQVRSQVGPSHFGVRYASANAEAHSLMDVNGDGIPDLAKVDSTTGLLDVWLGIPVRDTGGNLTSFGFSATRIMAVPSPGGVLAGLDLNGDGLGDVYSAAGGLLAPNGNIVYGQGGSFMSSAYTWPVTQWAGGATPAAAAVQPAAIPPVAGAYFNCPPPVGGSVVLQDVNYSDPRQTSALADLNGDGLPDLLVRPFPSDLACHSVVPCMQGYNLVDGAECYDAQMACPLSVYWNTGAGFEKGGTIQAPGCPVGASYCSGDLYPTVSYAPVMDPDITGVQCNYWTRIPGEPGGGSWVSSSAGTSTFTAWSAGFVDLDGDGMLDYATNRGGTWTFFRGTNVTPLLNKVTTAAGATYSVTYASGATYGAGPLDGAREVVTQVILSGSGIPTATTSYQYAGASHGPNPANFNRVEPRGFSESWSWLAEQGAGAKTAKHVTWVTSSPVLAGSPSQMEWGTFSGADPRAGFSAFKRTELAYTLKSLDAGTCTPPATPLTAASYPVMPITTLARNLDIIDASTSLGGQQVRTCDDVDTAGNVLKTTILTNGTWSSSFVSGETLVETSAFDLAATCKSCPKARDLKTTSGTTLSSTSYFYDSAVGTWAGATNNPGAGHLNYVSRWVSGARWDVDSATAYNSDGTVQSRVFDPYPGSHAVSTTENYTYDATQLRVTLTSRTDGTQTVYSSALYDAKGLLYSQTGPYLSGGVATAPTQAFARDLFGRVVAVGRSLTTISWGRSVIGAMAATEYIDTSPPMVKHYTFLAPVTFDYAGAVPVTPDVKQVVEFKDRLGRTVEVRERLGVAGMTLPCFMLVPQR